MLIRNVEINGRICDVRLDGEHIVEIGAGLSGLPGFDGQGGALLPGLHDHHIHLNASAAAMNSVKCGPPEVTSADDLIAALHKDGSGLLRGIGYHHSVAGEIDRAWLDANGPARPIRIQHRGGRLWIMNSLAMEQAGLNAPGDGRLLDADTELRQRSEFPDLQPLLSRLKSYGMTGVTEVTPSNGMAELENYKKQIGAMRLCVMGRAALTGSNDPIVGPLKLHYHDHNLPSLERLTAEIKAAHVAGRAVAAHCVTRAELMLTLAAIEEAGPLHGDRIEHAAIADAAAIEWMRGLGVIVVTQPNFIVERVEAYRKDVPAEDHENLWRLKSFQEAGLRCAAGSDAPFGDVNPWAAMAAAVSRPAGFEAEAISPEEALLLYSKPVDDAGAPSRKVAVGEPADLCLIDKPWNEARCDLVNVCAKATWIGGDLVYDAINQSPA